VSTAVSHGLPLRSRSPDAWDRFVKAILANTNGVHPFRTQETMSAALKHVDFELAGLCGALWTLGSLHNSLLPVSPLRRDRMRTSDGRLPSDVLIRIFSHHMTRKRWPRVSHVCRARRDLILGNPLLRRTFSNINRSPEWTREQLRRSGSVPLDIDIPVEHFGLVSHGSS